MSNFDDVKVFGDKSLSDLFKQIHKNNKDVDKQINDLIETLKPIATSNAGSAVMLMPTVKDLIDVNVRNNDQLVKMAGIVQRAVTSNSASDNNLINYDEIQLLLEEQKQVTDQTKQITDQIKQISNG